MSNTSIGPTTAIRGSSGGANTTAVAAEASAGAAMSMRGPSPPTTAAVIYPVASSGRGRLRLRFPILLTSILRLRASPPSLHPNVASSPFSASETKGHKGARERTKDLVTVRDRKVRITDGTSIYSLCRSCLRNGFPDETQPQYGDIFKSLPQPLPLPLPVTDDLPKDIEDREEPVEEDKKEDEQSVENLSSQDLLKRHINRAKKVRSRLQQERLNQIVRYKTRLALLLPPLVEQFRSDGAVDVGN